MRKVIASVLGLVGLFAVFSPIAGAESDNLCVVASLTKRSACVWLPALPPAP